MSNRALKKQGFTLIEVIITLVIVGIVAVTVGMSSVQIVKSFMFSAKNADTLLKGQVAVARIAKELNNVKTVDAAATNGTKIKFTSYRDAVDHTICRGATTCGTSGTNLLLSEGSVANVVLTDQVSNFSLAYYDNYKGTGTTNFSANSRIIEINLEITGWENTTAKFNARVAPSFPISIGP